MSPRFRVLWLLLPLGLLSGCPDGPKLYHVSGEVNYKGTPLPAGVIFFDPDATKKNSGPQGYAMIKDGKYDTSAQGGAPVVGGAYIVRIEGFDGKPGNELPLGKALFTDFQKAVDLPKENCTQNFEVPAKR